MAWSSQGFRRWSGAVYLGISILMLIVGATVLDNRLQGAAFIYYWLICTAFTCLALLIAVIDFRAVSRQSRREQGELIRDILSAVAKGKARSEGQNDQEESGG
jgi:hypothetical protein